MIKNILLNGREIILLLSRIKNEDIDFETGRSIGKDFVLKLASVFIELVTPEGIKSGEATIGVSEGELWLARAHISPYDKGVEGEPIGIRLLKKIFALLIEFDTEKQISPEIREGEIKEKTYKEVRNERQPEGSEPDPADTDKNGA